MMSYFNLCSLEIALVAAFLLDLILGDPKWLPHPVRVIGQAIVRLEPKLRKIFRDLKIAGVLLLVIVVASTYFIIWLFLKLSAIGHIIIFYALAALVFWTTISIKSLAQESHGVYEALVKDDLELARRRLSFIVGRDTENLSRREIVRATVETVAENTVDGVISPLFYAVIGGPALAMSYKAVNTLDSMVGYKNKRYMRFGWASAKFDELVNFIPARLSAMLMPAASFLAGLDAQRAFGSILNIKRKSPAQNAAIPEAAFAGALGVRLGGINYYTNVAQITPRLGDDICPLDAHVILEANRLLYATSFVTIVIFVAVSMFIRWQIYIQGSL